MANPKLEERVGTVVRRHVSGRSKHAHEAVLLETGDGDLILRREGANPFSDPELQALVGKRLRCRGEIDGATFFVTSWEDA
jgi:hypothetical protein